VETSIIKFFVSRASRDCSVSNTNAKMLLNMGRGDMATANEVFQHHLSVFGAGNIDEILVDYGDRVWRGLSGAREFFHLWIDDLGPAGSCFDIIDRQAVNDWLYITWTAESNNYKFDYGSDTFLIRDNKILRQTVATFHHRK
jgi:hypothetical protein